MIFIRVFLFVLFLLYRVWMLFYFMFSEMLLLVSISGKCLVMLCSDRVIGEVWVWVSVGVGVVMGVG